MSRQFVKFRRSGGGEIARPLISQTEISKLKNFEIFGKKSGNLKF